MTEQLLAAALPVQRLKPGEGAIVIGAPPIGLAIVRSLGRRRVPVCVLREGDHVVAATSRFTRFSLPWPEAEREQVEYLIDLATTRRLRGWTIFPTGDETAAFLARNHELLSECFLIASPPWNVLRWAYDKRLTYRLAAEVGVQFPSTSYPRSLEDLREIDCRFPAILKPAVKPTENRFTNAKAWLAENRESLISRYEEASALVPPDTVMIQELIPGGGETQFSYCALCDNGHPLAVLVARRTRQYPIDFGRASTFVETVDEQGMEEPARRLLAALRLTGIVELEFKRDPRDGQFKLLDINARAWAWQALGGLAGVDFPYLLWCLLRGAPVPPVRAATPARWIRPATDLRAAVKELAGGSLRLSTYVRSIRRPLVSALFASDDPLPAILEGPLFSSVALRRMFRARLAK